jgi:acetate kinase
VRRKLWISSATVRRNTSARTLQFSGGLDVLVFAGGIGEHAPGVRKRICDGLDFLGIRLDVPANEANAPLISSSESRVKVRVIKTNEDLMIVRHVESLLGWSNS